MVDIIHKQFGDNLEFKHPICKDCRGNTFTVEISENDDVILNCVKCANRIDFQIINRKNCCKWPEYCGGECTCKICAPDLHIERLEYELEECRCIKSSYFDDSLKCGQAYRRLEAKLAWLVEVSESIYNSHLRCETPIKEQVTPTRYKEKWKLHDCGECPSCQLKAAIDAAKQGRE